MEPLNTQTVSACAVGVGTGGRTRTDLSNQIVKKIAKSPVKSRETRLNSPEFFITPSLLLQTLSLTLFIIN